VGVGCSNRIDFAAAAAVVVESLHCSRADLGLEALAVEC
jgi:hypothetical protein